MQVNKFVENLLCPHNARACVHRLSFIAQKLCSGLILIFHLRSSQCVWEEVSNQQQRKKLSERRQTFNDLRSQVKELAQDYFFLRSCWLETSSLWAVSRSKTSHLGAKTSKFDTWNSDVWRHLKTCFAGVRSRVDAILICDLHVGEYINDPFL